MMMMMDGQMPQPQDDANMKMEYKQIPPVRTQDTVLFVGNLPFRTPWQDVKDHFRNAGAVRYTDLIADRNGRPKGSALVTMSTIEGAENAIRMFNETLFHGRRLIVRKFDNGPWPALVQRNMMRMYSTMPERRMFYDGMNVNPPGMNSTSMGGYYPPSGSMMNGNSYMPSNGMYNPTGSYHVGDSVDDMLPQINEFGAEQLPKPRSQQVQETGRRLFISNLPFDCNSSALRETFQQIGEVERAEIILGWNNKSRGCGIVVMKTEKEAQKAIEEFDGIEMSNRPMKVRLDDKFQKRTQQYQGYNNMQYYWRNMEQLQEN